MTTKPLLKRNKHVLKSCFYCYPWKFLQVKRLYCQRFSTNMMGLLVFEMFLKFFITFIVITSSTTLAQNYNKYRDPGGNFSTVLYDIEFGDVYIGGLNKVYKLNSDLELQVQGSIGPRMDHPACPIPPEECPQRRTSRNNSNKVLLKYGDKIVSCGTVYNGSCEYLYLTNLTMIPDTISLPIINTEGKSAAIIANDDATGESKLIIGTSPASEPDLPSYTTRSLVDFHVDKVSLTKAQKKATNDAINNGFKIDFIHAFVSNSVNYFVMVYDEKYGEITQKYQTYIAHHCQSDVKYFSYIELPLVCRHNGQSYTLAQSAYLANRVPSEPNTSELILVVTFGMSENGASLTPERKSAVCLFSLKDTIEYSFLEAYKACTQGNTTFKTIRWAGSNQHECTVNTVWGDYLSSEQVPYCHDLEQIPDLGGAAPITADAIYQEDNMLFTSVVFQYVDEVQQSVIFLGDDEGNLTKLRLDSLTAAQRYEKKTIDAESPVIRNGLVYSNDNTSVYITTQQQITKVPVEECEQYTTCNECLGVGDGTGDPYCGWCTLMNRCTRKSNEECTWADKVGENRWMNDLNQCVQISNIEPANLPSNMQIELTLTVRSLPTAPAETYSCVFENIKTTPVTSIDNSTTPPTLKCPTPPAEDIQSGVSLEVKLSLLSHETNMEFVSSEFVFYDCSAFKDCTGCVSSDFACDWCIYENKCTGNSQPCELQGVVGGQGNAFTNATKFGPENCPHLTKRDTEILLAVNTRSPIEVLAQNLPTLEAGNTGYECVLDEEVVEAEVTNNTIKCKPKEYSYSELIPDKPILLRVRWNDNFMIDNPYNVTVVLYKCEVNRTTCGKCLLADSKYDCGWCDQSSCHFKDLCEVGTSFLSGNVVCPNPRITSFSPMKGPTEGGTCLIIKGENLGLSFNDTESITVADVECKPEEEGYVPSEQLQCTLSYTEASKSGTVQVTISKEETWYSTTSETAYEFVIPKVKMISPTLGPKSGGTNVILEGEHLDAGSTVNVTIADYQCQNIERKNDGTIHCTTSPVTNLITGGVHLMIDNGEDDSGVMFMYKTDPIITDIEWDKAIASGGTKIKVNGQNLHVAKNKMLTMNISEEVFYGDCVNATSDSMTCKAPDIFSKFSLGDSDFMLVPNYGFILDGVVEYQSLKDSEKFQSFRYYVNPVYYQLENNEYKQDDVENLAILGENLNLASKSEDVEVKIGRGMCEVTVLGNNQLICIPPEEQPLNFDGSDSSPEVIVYHSNLNFSVGPLTYYKPLPLPLEVLITIAAVCVLAILLILVYCVYRCKRDKSEQKLKQVRQQVDQLKMQVAQESRSTSTVAGNRDGMNMAQPERAAHDPYNSSDYYEIKPLMPPGLCTSQAADNNGLNMTPIMPVPKPTQPERTGYDTRIYASDYDEIKPRIPLDGQNVGPPLPPDNVRNVAPRFPPDDV